MNLPNKLTLLRIILVPIFLVCMYVQFPFHYTAALVIFALASITDALDGNIARKNNLVTTFGKFADPLADKILVLAALASICDLTGNGHGAQPINGIVVTVIAAREFMVSGLRLVTAEKGVVVAAAIWGKLKTAFTMAAIVFLLLIFAICNDFGVVFSSIVYQIVVIAEYTLVWLSVLLTVISGGVYLKCYWKYIDLK